MRLTSIPLFSGPRHVRGPENANSSFLAALERRDAKGAAATYAADARLLPPFAGMLAGRDAIEAFWQAGLDTGLASVELDPLKARRSDRLAYELGRYAMHVRPDDGEAVVDRGTYVLVCERQADGSWSRAIEMFESGGAPVKGPRRHVDR